MAKTHEKDAASVMSAFLIIISRNGVAFNRLKIFLEILFVKSLFTWKLSCAYKHISFF